MRPKNGHQDFVDAFTIFAKYEPDASFAVSAEHDVIYACHVNPENMDDADIQRLDTLGWSYDSDDLGRWQCYV